jgi:hypothetical protein
LISEAASTQGAASCWLAITPNGKFVYTSNSISTFYRESSNLFRKFFAILDLARGGRAWEQFLIESRCADGGLVDRIA